MNPKMVTKLLMRAILVAALASTVIAQEKRELKVIEDRGQRRMTTKIYELKHVKAVDITPFVLGAVMRYSSESSVERLNCKPTKQQFLVVSTGEKMMPYVDDLIAKLDRPGKIDENGSLINGSGITNSIYYPRYRMASEFVDIAKTVGSSDGNHFVDLQNNIVYWKDSKSDGGSVVKNLQFFDKPIPQIEMTLNIYEVSDDDLKELGIDYISWKNGPGANIFASGFDFFDFQKFIDSGDWTNSINTAASLTNSWGGFMVAPQFDATFLRLLNQKGKAKIASSGILTVTNDFNYDPGAKKFSKAKFKIKFSPNYQGIVKDKNQNVNVKSSGSELYFYLRRPTITFNGLNAEEKVVAAKFGWELQISDTVEKTNDGTDVRDQYYFTGWTTIDVGTEKLLASYAKEQKSNQNNGIPWLCEIPVLKYLFGSTVESNSYKRVFITVSTKPLDPKMDISQWAGNLINLTEMAINEVKKSNQ